MADMKDRGRAVASAARGFSSVRELVAYLRYALPEVEAINPESGLLLDWAINGLEESSADADDALSPTLPRTGTN